jgi:hypothetical protein
MTGHGRNIYNIFGCTVYARLAKGVTLTFTPYATVGWLHWVVEEQGKKEMEWVT